MFLCPVYHTICNTSGTDANSRSNDDMPFPSDFSAFAGNCVV